MKTVTMIVLSICLLPALATSQDCLEYGNYIHWVGGGVPSGNLHEFVTVAGDWAYVSSWDGGIFVIDVSDPQNPREVYFLDLGNDINQAVVVGDYLFAAAGSQWGSCSFHVIDISTPDLPQPVSSVPISGQTAWFLDIADNYAYVTSSSAGVYVVDISNLTEPQIVTQVFMFHDVGGVEIAGKYMYVGDWDPNSGMQVYDISDPANPVYLFTEPEDSHYYCLQVYGDYLFAADDDFGVRVLDLSDPAAPVRVGPGFPMPEGCDWIELRDDYAYAAGHSMGLYVIDMANPEDPQFVSRVDTPGNTVDVALWGNHAFTAEWGPMQIIDISFPESTTTPEAVAILGAVDTPGQAKGVAVAGDVAYVADGGDGLQAIDVTDPENPTITYGVDTPGTAYDVAIAGTHAYVADGSGGLQVIDTEIPGIVGAVDTPGSARAVVIAGDLAYVADQAAGLQVIDITDPTNPQITGNVDSQGWAFDVAVSDDCACVADFFFGLQVVDISDPENPWEMAYLDELDDLRGVAIHRDHAFVVGNESGLHIIDIENPADPQIVAHVNLPADAFDVVAQGRYAYVACDWSGLWVIDIVHPDDPRIIGNVDTFGYFRGVALADSFVCIADDPDGLVTASMECPIPIVGVDEHDGEIPGATISLSAFPNPFNPQTTIVFSLVRSERAEIGIFDLTGRRVAVLAEREFAAGDHRLTWRGLDTAGRAVPSGTYFVRLETGSRMETSKVMLMK